MARQMFELQLLSFDQQIYGCRHELPTPRLRSVIFDGGCRIAERCEQISTRSAYSSGPIRPAGVYLLQDATDSFRRSATSNPARWKTAATGCSRVGIRSYEWNGWGLR